ncbi:Os06g0541600 [Oryza sativa Japonica Group]|uniref:Os06g0541600 protein n=1 Tax=Oryza sativa subsp. japonica TaxID=39947 RepID=C7J484_ORYSJ|nr:Os06g0541600 [Oryza sativa Japonica Group]|eukprot:NP_001174840.1 Os06g0541600 [Oryza sativa Japonica Group]
MATTGSRGDGGSSEGISLRVGVPAGVTEASASGGSGDGVGEPLEQGRPRWRAVGTVAVVATNRLALKSERMRADEHIHKRSSTQFTEFSGQLNGLPVAVKRCFVESSPERLSDFENEIKFIPRLQHRNIVTLKGYCIEGKERILVYEYMQNKSLDKFIFGPRTDWSLYWDRLFAIIEGIAQGIVNTLNLKLGNGLCLWK